MRLVWVVVGLGDGRGRSRYTRDAHISESRYGHPVLRGRREASRGSRWDWLLGEEGEDFGLGMGVGDAEEGAGDGEVEAAGAGAAGVEVEDSVVVLDGGFVGVAVDHDGDAGGVGVEVEILAGVDDVDQAAG